MDYMFLIYHDRLGYGIVTQEIIEAGMKNHREIQSEANAKGVLKSSAGLGKPDAAKSVHVSDGQVTVTDGPFAETKEALGGYYIIDCKDNDEARYWATRIAHAGGKSTVEFRRIDYGGKRPVSDEAAASSK